MSTKPFLSNFAKQLKQSGCEDRVKMVYNETLDYNEFSENGLNDSSVFLHSQTKTAIKAESPDYTGSPSRRFIHLASKTITEVKPEKPDVHSGYRSSNEFVMVQTTTRVKDESPDK